MDIADVGLGVFLVVVALLWLLPVFLRTASFNNDPLQGELAALIVEYANSELSDASSTLFAVSTMRAFTMRMVVEEKEQRDRLAHALSLAKPHLTPMQYQFMRQVLRK